jgi:hypothetical protein
MQKQNIELLQDLYSNFAQFIYAVRAKYFAMDIKYAMPTFYGYILQVPDERNCAYCRLFITWQTYIPYHSQKKHISCICNGLKLDSYMHDQCVQQCLSLLDLGIRLILLIR